MRRGRFSEVGVFRSSPRLPLLNVLDWWHEAGLGMLLWATRVVSEGGRLGARDRVAHLPARCGSTARPTRPHAEGALPDLAGPWGPRDGLRARRAQHRDPPGGDLRRLSPAPAELGGLLLFAARSARPTQADRAAGRGPRARHDGSRRCDRA